MKIGILTYWNTKDNYGQLLQCYAMQKFFEKMGHDAFLVKCDFEAKLPITFEMLLEKVIRVLLNPIFYIKKIIEREEKLFIPVESYQNRHFDLFLEKYIHSTNDVYTYSQLLSSCVDADAFVCGSDQIWSGLSPLFFLQFASKKAKCLACAPSLGGVHVHWYERNRIKRYLSKFCYLSAREEDGVKELHKLGFKNAELMPDPTLLLHMNDYSYLEENESKLIPQNKYLFLYLLGNTIGIEVKEIFDFAKQRNLEIVYVASQGRKDIFQKVTPTIGEWLSLIKHSEYVITNSFHGTVFSLQYHKKIGILPLVGEYAKMNSRITTLFNKYKISNHFLYDKNLTVIEKTIDYNYFELTKEEDFLKFSSDIDFVLK